MVFGSKKLSFDYGQSFITLKYSELCFKFSNTISTVNFILILFKLDKTVKTSNSLRCFLYYVLAVA